MDELGLCNPSGWVLVLAESGVGSCSGVNRASGRLMGVFCPVR